MPYSFCLIANVVILPSISRSVFIISVLILSQNVNTCNKYSPLWIYMFFTVCFLLVERVIYHISTPNRSFNSCIIPISSKYQVYKFCRALPLVCIGIFILAQACDEMDHTWLKFLAELSVLYFAFEMLTALGFYIASIYFTYLNDVEYIIITDLGQFLASNFRAEIESYIIQPLPILPNYDSL